MLQVGDHVRVKAGAGGPEISPSLACFRLRLWGLTGIVTAVVPLLDRPIVVGFVDPFVPREVRFWGRDLVEVRK